MSVDRDLAIKMRSDLWDDWDTMTFELAPTIAAIVLLKMQSAQISNVSTDLD